jgi:hypothetical protein
MFRTRMCVCVCEGGRVRVRERVRERVRVCVCDGVGKGAFGWSRGCLPTDGQRRWVGTGKKSHSIISRSISVYPFS